MEVSTMSCQSSTTWRHGETNHILTIILCIYIYISIRLASMGQNISKILKVSWQSDTSVNLMWLPNLNPRPHCATPRRLSLATPNTSQQIGDLSHRRTKSEPQWICWWLQAYITLTVNILHIGSSMGRRFPQPSSIFAKVTHFYWAKAVAQVLLRAKKMPVLSIALSSLTIMWTWKRLPFECLCACVFCTVFYSYFIH